MMMLHLWRNEWQYYRRQPIFWLAILLTLAFSGLLMLNQPALSAQPAKELLFNHTKLLMLVHSLLVGVLAALAFYRDPQHKMHELIGATPLTRWQWLVSRAGALLLVTATLQLLLSGLLTLTLTPITTAQTPMPNNAQTGAALYWLAAQLWLLQQLPALLLLVALQLWVSQQSQQMGWSWLLTLVCWLGYMLLAASTGSPLMANPQTATPWLSQLMHWLDPYALTPWLAELSQTVPQNSLALPTTTLIINRLLIILLAMLLCWRAWLAAPCGQIQPAAAGKGRRPSPLFVASPAGSTPMPAATTAPETKATVNKTAVNKAPLLRLARWPAFCQLLRLQLSQLLRQRASLFALLLLVGLIVSQVLTSSSYAEAFSQLQPSSRDALNQINWDILPRFGMILLCWWAHQLSWLNRQLACDSLIAATPQPSWLMLGSQMAALWLLTLLLFCTSYAGVLLAQLLNHWPIQGLEYLQQGLLQLLPLGLWGCLLLSCHALSATPLRANLLVAMLLILAITPLPAMLGLTHPLWHPLQSNLQMPDALWGYQGSTVAYSTGVTLSSALSRNWGGDWSQGGYWPYLQFWGLVTLALTLLAFQRYHRGLGMRPAPDHTATYQQHKLLAALCLSLALWQGWQLHQQLQQAGALQSSTDRERWRANYEHRYQHWQAQPQPVLSNIKLAVRLEPSKLQATISATMTLTNPHDSAIEQILLGWPDPAFRAKDIQRLQLQQGLLLRHDAELTQFVYQLDRPLAAGASTNLQLELHLQQSALAQLQFQQIIRPEFSYLRLWQLLPQAGFIGELRLKNPATRARYGLAALADRDTLPSVQSADATPAQARYDWVQLETVLTVPDGYQGIAAGKLVRQWQPAAGQQRFAYQTTAPIRNLPAIVAVPWQAQQMQQHGVDLAIYSPYYNETTALTWQALRDTLQWFNQQIGAYPGDSLKLVMTPDLGASGYALPQLILINHRVGLRAQPSANAGFSQVYRRAVHEMAHQWFGHGIGNGVPGDGTFLIEALAKYVELVLLEQHYGSTAMQALVDYERQRFVRADRNSTAMQLNLLDANAGHDQYSRATLVFAKLRSELGDAVITAALRQLWQQHRYPAKPASAMDFVRALRLQSKAKQHQLIHQLLLDSDTSWLESTVTAAPSAP